MSIALFSREEWFPHVVCLASACVRQRPVTSAHVAVFLSDEVHQWTWLNAQAHNTKYRETQAPVGFTGAEILSAWRNTPRLASSEQVRATLRWLADLRRNCEDGDVGPDMDHLSVLTYWYESLVRRMFPVDPG